MSFPSRDQSADGDLGAEGTQVLEGALEAVERAAEAQPQAIVTIAPRMSAFGGKADSLAHHSACLLIATSGSQASWFQHPGNSPKLLPLPHSS